MYLRGLFGQTMQSNIHIQDRRQEGIESKGRDKAGLHESINIWILKPRLLPVDSDSPRSRSP